MGIEFPIVCVNDLDQEKQLSDLLLCTIIGHALSIKHAQSAVWLCSINPSPPIIFDDHSIGQSSGEKSP
ncbi:MAG: hypothetical protein P8163_20740 [Candidatus Thiodiazotropha sp.]